MFKKGMSLNGIPFLFELIGDPLTATLFLRFYSNPISSTNINAGLPFPQCHVGMSYSGRAIIFT